MDDSSQGEVRVICGPTAAGKTRVATWLAERFDISIVSADSRQLYRGFDIGTAKPSAQERAAIPHLGVDVLEPTERSSAAWWAGQALEWLGEVEMSDRTPVVVGGTGLYLRGLFGTFFEEPELDTARRAGIQRALGDMSVEDLRRWVTALDPQRAHLGRTQLLRAVEIALLTGERISDLHRMSTRPPRRVARYLVVDPGPRLSQDIEARVDRMIEQGWPAEVEALSNAVEASAPAWNASGYQAIRQVVDGSISVEEGRERIVIETRQYAKRQRTWFRHQLPPERVTKLDPFAPDWEATALAWYTGGPA